MRNVLGESRHEECTHKNVHGRRNETKTKEKPVAVAKTCELLVFNEQCSVKIQCLINC